MGKLLDAIGGAPLAIQQRAAVAALDDQFAEMEAEITSLRAENLHLQAQVNPLQREIDGYKKQLQLKSGLDLHETETLILRFMTHEQKGVFAGEISKATGLNEIRIRHFLRQLGERGLVHERQHYSGGTFFALSPDGMTYAVEQGWA